jgi:carbonic anhydrase
VQQLEAKGKLQLHGAHFDIGSGQLTVLNEETREFETV